MVFTFRHDHPQQGPVYVHGEAESVSQALRTMADLVERGAWNRDKYGW